MHLLLLVLVELEFYAERAMYYVTVANLPKRPKAKHRLKGICYDKQDLMPIFDAYFGPIDDRLPDFQALLRCSAFFFSKFDSWIASKVLWVQTSGLGVEIVFDFLSDLKCEG